MIQLFVQVLIIRFPRGLYPHRQLRWRNVPIAELAAFAAANLAPIPRYGRRVPQ
jgi:hypothetical protein